MSLKKLMSILCMLAISVIVFTACESDDDPQPPPPPIDPITVSPVGTMHVGQTGANAITVRWVESPSHNQSWFAGYELVISAQGELNDTIPFSTPYTAIQNQFEYVCTGLNAERTYTFEVRAVGIQPEDSSVVRSTPNAITWALATHFTTNENQAPIFVYTRESSDFGSGLQLSHIPYPPGQEGPRIRRIINGADWNLAVGSRDNLIIGSALAVATAVPYHLTGTPTHNFEITDPVDFDTDVLNNMLMPNDLSTMSYGNRSFNLATNSVAQSASKGVVFFARGNNHYAKIVVLKNGTGGGGYLHSPTSNPYVHLLVSYQTRNNQPFAKPSN